MSKLLNIIKTYNSTEIKLFSISLWQRIYNKGERYIKYRILNGLFVYRYDIKSDVFYLRFLDTRYLELNIIMSRLAGTHKIWYLFFMPVWFKCIEKDHYKKFLDKLIKKYPEYNEYYIFGAHSGEFFLLMLHLESIITNNKSKNFVLVFMQKYHENICKMFYPDLNTITISNNIYAALVVRGTNKYVDNYKNKKIFLYINANYFVNVEKEIRNNNAHYYDKLKEALKLPDNIKKYSITDWTKIKIEKIINSMLGEKFVIISPESASNERLPNSFWVKLVDKIHTMGYEVFCNATNFSNVIKGTKAVFLTYEEVICLAQSSSAVIGLRSGLMECIVQPDIPSVVLYTDFPERPPMERMPSAKVMSGFSIKKLPHANKDLVFEYDANKYEKADDMIPEIIERIQQN